MRQPSKEEWSMIRPIFTELYENTDLILDDIAKLLLREYGFQATPRMFSYRIRLWELGRHKREDDVLIVYRKLRQRDAVEKPSLIFIHGREVSREQLDNYLGRKRIASTDLDLERVSGRATPDYIRCISPPMPDNASDSSSSLNALTPTSSCDGFGSIDYAKSTALRSVQAYHEELFSTQPWSVVCQVEDLDLQSLRLPAKFGGLFFHYHTFRAVGQSDDAQISLDKAVAMLPTLFHSPDPSLLIYVLESVVFLQSEGHETLADMLLDYCSRILASNDSDNDRPWRQSLKALLTSLRQSDPEVARHMIEVTTQCLIAQFRGYKYELMRVLLTAATIFKRSQNSSSAFATLQELTGLYLDNYGPHSHQHCHALVNSAYVKIDDSDYIEADRYVEAAMKVALEVKDDFERMESLVRSSLALARSQEAQGQLEQTEASYRRVLILGEEILGSEHWMIMDARTSLQRFLSQ